MFAKLAKQDPDRARQNSQARAGTNFTKPRTSLIYELCTKISHRTVCTLKDYCIQGGMKVLRRVGYGDEIGNEIAYDFVNVQRPARRCTDCVKQQPGRARQNS